MARHIALERVQPPSRCFQVGRRFGAIKGVKLNGEPCGMGRLNSCLASGPEEFLDPGVPKALDHVLSVAHHAHGGKEIR